MLRLMIGKAGTGKTAACIREISRAVEARQGGRMLIVPEQYSHEAERELCQRCGDSMSLYAEVFSFTALAGRLMSQLGGGARKYLDEGGRLLCMALALSGVGSRLKVYGAAQRKAELQALLLTAVDEMKSAGITPDMLYTAAADCEGALGDKAADLALISEAYAAAVANGHADPSDKLDILAAQIPKSSLGGSTYAYVDGFVDFTHQELEVLRAFLRKGVELTVSLTVDELHGDNEIFELSRNAARRLLAFAGELGVETKIERFDNSVGKDAALEYFADNMFSYGAAAFEEEHSAVELWQADSFELECEFAASRAIELVRDGGCRWRDIAIAVRGFDDYRQTLQSVFRHYGVPIFVSRRSEIMQKPLPTLISSAYDMLSGGWDVDDVFCYMGTGLSGLSPDECDILKNYVYMWQLRRSAWEREADWRQHPDGYGGVYDDSANARLAHINSLRRTFAEPLLNFQKDSLKAETAIEQATALAGLFKSLKLPQQLEQRSKELSESGREELAQEYSQLWDIIVSSLEQAAAILGDAPMDSDSFSRLYTLMLSKYDVGVIPVSLDSVSAGDFDRMRRRNIKNLIVLGVSDQRLPKAGEEGGVFSEDERRRLREKDIDLGCGGESELWREFSLIYNCLSLPSEKLIMCCPALSASGDEQHPAFVYNRAKAIFDIEPRRVDSVDIRLNAPAPAMTLAAHAVKGGGARELSAKAYFMREEPQRYAKLASAAELSRGRLSQRGVEALYGRSVKLSASRVEKFSSCKFAYFCQYGLKAKPYEPAGFTPPEIGVFMHYVLEHTAREVKERGGFIKVTDQQLRGLTDKYVALYVHEELNDFQEKSRRFVYLFKRLSADVHQVVADMAAELRNSDFVPLDFELDFANAQQLKPLELGEGLGSAALSGIADRVDGWVHDNKLYLRVVDYKTGKKSFSLSDVWYGMGLQLLLYLFALNEDGEKLYGREIVPAGVMYVPARNAMLSAQRELSGEELRQKRGETVKRSGLLLDDAALIEAWEHGDEKKYIPIKYRYKKPTADSLASAERLGLLSKHINKRLTEMAKELRGGSIAADPYYRGQQESACLNCDYFDACWFKDGDNGESCRYQPKLSPEQVWEKLEEKEDSTDEQI